MFTDLWLSQCWAIEVDRWGFIMLSGCFQRQLYHSCCMKIMAAL